MFKMSKWHVLLIFFMGIIDLYIIVDTAQLCPEPRIFLYVTAASLQVAVLIILLNAKVYFHLVKNSPLLRNGLFMFPLMMMIFSFAILWQAKSGTYTLGGHRSCEVNQSMVYR